MPVVFAHVSRTKNWNLNDTMIDIDFEALRPIGWTPAIASQLYLLEDPPPVTSRVMRIVEVQRDWFGLHDGHTELRGRVLQKLLQALGAGDTALTVGDWVLVETHASQELWICARVLPLTQIARRANDGRRQTLASNIDTALLVMGLDQDFNPRRMERYIALVRASGVVPVVVLTKSDIAANAREHVAEVCDRLPATLPVLAVNGLSVQARIDLAPWVHAGQTLVVLGSSGAGKSTLTNTLTGALQDTGPVRRGDGRGQHTTTARSLHLCAAGGCIIDTPGLRTWRADTDAQALASAFEDIDCLAARCQFRDCRHESEPGCAVRDEVDGDRLLNYHKLLRDARRGLHSPLERVAQRRKWRALGKAGANRAHDKRG